MASSQRLFSTTLCRFLGTGKRVSCSGGSVMVLILPGVCGEQLYELFLYTVISIAAVTVFSYLVALSSKLFLSQAVIFTFYAPSSLLQPPT